MNSLGLTYGLGYVNYIGEDIKNLYQKDALYKAIEEFGLDQS
jgi:preprotein translocase subunit SecA